jgi:hypothetical protein
MGRKAYGSHRDSRVAEISPDIFAPAFLFCQVKSGAERYNPSSRTRIDSLTESGEFIALQAGEESSCM